MVPYYLCFIVRVFAASVCGLSRNEAAPRRLPCLKVSMLLYPLSRSVLSPAAPPSPSSLASSLHVTATPLMPSAPPFPHVLVSFPTSLNNTPPSSIKAALPFPSPSLPWLPRQYTVFWPAPFSASHLPAITPSSLLLIHLSFPLP